MDIEKIISAIFALSPQVRYVAVANGQDIELRQRPGLSGASSSESDRFEELLVNPALVLLTRQRGNIDCGGLRYIIVRYGQFFQIVVPRTGGGHVSVAIEPDADPTTIGESIEEVVR